MKESVLTKKMVELLKARGAWARKIHGNMYTAGLPDITACYRGWYLALEVKVPGRENTVTAIQQKTLDDIDEAGGFAQVVTTLSDIDALLDQIDELEDE